MDVCICEWGLQCCSVSAEIGGQPGTFCTLLQLSQFWWSNSSLQTWEQVVLPAELHHPPWNTCYFAPENTSFKMKQHLTYVRLVLNSLCSLGWPETAPPLKWWDATSVPACLVFMQCWDWNRASCMLGKHSVNWATLSAQQGIPLFQLNLVFIKL